MAGETVCSMESPNSFFEMIENGTILEVDKRALKILENIGHGSYGKVDKVLYNGELIAAKTLTPTSTKDKKQIESDFIKEVKYLAKVDHKNIVRLIGITKNREYLLTEYMEHGSLYSFLHDQDELGYTFGHSLNWLQQTADAMNHLHRMKPKPIIHRDLKSLNLLLADYGRGVKICDFGTARYLDFVMSSMKGSPAWMAPEVFAGNKYDEKCDVYSFGIILWELLTRQIPFAEYSERGAIPLLYQKATSGIHPPDIEGIPESLREIMESCWSLDTTKRPSFDTIFDFFRYFNQFVKDGDKAIFKETSPTSAFNEAFNDVYNDNISSDELADLAKQLYRIQTQKSTPTNELFPPQVFTMNNYNNNNENLSPMFGNSDAVELNSETPLEPIDSLTLTHYVNLDTAAISPQQFDKQNKQLKPFALERSRSPVSLDETKHNVPYLRRQSQAFDTQKQNVKSYNKQASLPYTLNQQDVEIYLPPHYANNTTQPFSNSNHSVTEQPFGFNKMDCTNNYSYLYDENRLTQAIKEKSRERMSSLLDDDNVNTITNVDQLNVPTYNVAFTPQTFTFTPENVTPQTFTPKAFTPQTFTPQSSLAKEKKNRWKEGDIPSDNDMRYINGIALSCIPQFSIIGDASFTHDRAIPNMEVYENLQQRYATENDDVIGSRFRDIN